MNKAEMERRYAEAEKMGDQAAVVTQLRSHGFNEGANEIERLKVAISIALTHLPEKPELHSHVVVQDRIQNARLVLERAIEFGS